MRFYSFHKWFQLENDVASMEEELQKFNSENEKLKEFTTQLGQLIEKKDTDAIMNESGRWLQKFQNLLSVILSFYPDLN